MRVWIVCNYSGWIEGVFSTLENAMAYFSYKQRDYARSPQEKCLTVSEHELDLNLPRQ